MSNKNPTLQDILDRDVEKLRETAFPVHSSLLRRLFVRYYNCERLHPNPDDEFCDPAIGPSDRIIQQYAEKLRRPKGTANDYVQEPIQIVRIYPEGYMILNGHHRWAATLRTGKKLIRVQLVNPTSESDIRRMLKHVRNDRRVTIDLDEVVFGSTGDFELEEALPEFYNRLYRQRIRKGIPALFDYLENNGYDVWLYSCKYYPRNYLIRYFLHYKVHVRFFITGIRKRSKIWSLIGEKYKSTLHIDAHSVVRVNKDDGEYEDYDLDGGEDWVKAVIEVLKKMERDNG